MASGFAVEEGKTTGNRNAMKDPIAIGFQDG